MQRMHIQSILLAWAFLSTSWFAAGCSAAPSLGDATSDTSKANPELALDALEELPGQELIIRVGAEAATLVDLERAMVVDTANIAESKEWDLAFQSWDVFTNSGPSGSGQGAAFGPLDELDYLFEEVPVVPFMSADATGGTFLDWYAYDSTNHQLWSRYHLYGVKAGERVWKVQIMSYYGEEFGAPVSALYRLRYAEVSANGSSQTTELVNLDATAGYPEVSATTPSGCLDLDSGEVSLLTPDEALVSSDWQLCFRRDVISVNGEEGGPGEVTAVDLDSFRTAGEALEDVQARTPESELQRFEQLDYADLNDETLKYRGDRVVSVFDGSWFDGKGANATPSHASWLILGADGRQHYLVIFRAIDGDASAAGEVVLRVRKVEGH